MNNNIFWLLEVSINEGQFDNFKEIMNEMVEGTQGNEPGTLNYEWTLSEDKKSCHIYERYSDSEAVMIHLGNFGQKYAERFLATVQPQRIVVHGKDSVEVKSALSDFGAVFMIPIGGFAR